MRKFARVVALLLVAVSSTMQALNIPADFRQTGATLLQQSVAVGGLLHCLLGAVVVIGAVMGKRWAVNAAIAWTVAVAYTASVASVAWEARLDGGAIFGAVAAGLSCILLGWWVTWAARESVRPHIPATTEPSSPPR